MNPRTRRALHAAAWVVFLAGSPLLLAYAWGYRLSLSQPPDSFVPGSPTIGALVVRTVPRGAQVLLDGRVVDERTPAGVNGVLAGMHHVRIVKSGYRLYEKTLDVIGGRVTDLLHIRLIPETLDEEIVRGGVSGVWISPDGQWVAFLEGSALSILPRRALNTMTPEQTLRDVEGFQVRLPVHRAGELFMQWSSSGDAAAIGVIRGDDSGIALPESLALLDLRRHSIRPLPARTRLIGWSRTGEERLTLLTTEGVLQSLSRENPKPEERAVDIRTAVIHPRGVLIQRVPEQEGELPFGVLRAQGEFQAFLPPFPEPARVVKVAVDGALAGISLDATLFVLATEEQSWRAVAENVRSLEWSPDGTKLFFQQSQFDVSVLNVSEDRSILTKFQPQFLHRMSLPLRNLQWFPDSQHLLTFDQDILRFVEIDPRGERRTEHLVSVDRGDAFATATDHGDRVYVTARRPINGRMSDVLLRLYLRTTNDR